MPIEVAKTSALYLQAQQETTKLKKPTNYCRCHANSNINIDIMYDT